VTTVIGRLHRDLVFGRRVRVLADRLAPLFPARTTVLDIGCGDGTLAASLMQRRNVHITGLDVLLRPDAKIEVQSFDGSHLQFEDGSFDIALLVDVLHHTDDPAVLLSEARRVARRAVILKDHLLQGFGARATLSLMDWFGNAHHGVRLPYNYWTPVQWRNAFERSRLEVTWWDDSLELYPRPFSWMFDRHLHFIAVLSPAAGQKTPPRIDTAAKSS
jgi:SAM-dependent methyltransferase